MRNGVVAPFFKEKILNLKLAYMPPPSSWNRASDCRLAISRRLMESPDADGVRARQSPTSDRVRAPSRRRRLHRSPQRSVRTASVRRPCREANRSEGSLTFGQPQTAASDSGRRGLTKDWNIDRRLEPRNH